MTDAGRTYHDSGPPLEREFYERSVVAVARDLVGCILHRVTADGEMLCGRVVETEAYRHDDPASHSYSGPSRRNASMFGAAGHAYVYLIYGMYECFNVVCGPPGVADAVLIRAVEPLAGINTMHRNRFGRGDDRERPGSGRTARPGRLGRPGRPDEAPVTLTSGPGKVCRAFGITREEVDGTSLVSGPVTIHGGIPQAAVVATARIGISKATENEWRFIEKGNRFLSRRG